MSAFNGAALTHGFGIAFWVLAVIAAVGAVLGALMLESQPPAAEHDGEAVMRRIVQEPITAQEA